MTGGRDMQRRFQPCHRETQQSFLLLRFVDYFKSLVLLEIKILLEFSTLGS